LRRFGLLIALLLTLVCVQQAISDNRDVGDISASEDPRLDRKVTLSMNAGTVAEALRGLASLTGVTLQITGRAAEQGMRLALKDAALSDVLTQTAILFGWRWRRAVREGEIVYRLEGGGNIGAGDPGMVRQTLAAAVRDEAAKQWAQMRPTLEAWMAAEGDPEAIKNSAPEVGATLEKNPEMTYRIAELSRLPEAERQMWIEGRVYAQLNRDGPAAKYALVSKYVISRISVTGQVSSKENEPTVSVKLQGEVPFWTVMEALNKQTGLSFVSDRYSRRITVADIGFEKAPLWQVLDRVCRDAAYFWEKSDKMIRLRGRLWFYDELREPPKQVINRWLQIKKQRGKLTFADLVSLVASLTDDQIAGLAASESVADKSDLIVEGRNILNALNEFRLYRMLNREQVRAAEGPEGLRFLRMTPQQQDLFLRYAPAGPLPSEHAAASVLFIIPRGEQSVTFRYDYGLGLIRFKEVIVAVPKESPAPAEARPAEVPKTEAPESAPKEETAPKPETEKEPENGL